MCDMRACIGDLRRRRTLYRKSKNWRKNMIRLRQDCLVFKNTDGTGVPASAHEFAVEIIGEAVGMLDEEVVKNAAHAVLHYFKEELHRTSVTIGEFTGALEDTLRKLGYNIDAAQPKKKGPQIITSNLQEIVGQIGAGYELLFFSRLRDEVRSGLGKSPELLRFRGLRDCVKHLAGAKRWNTRCQALSEQIVDYLRTCLHAEKEQRSCSLLVF